MKGVRELVVDNSVALAWCFEDEHTEPIMALLDRVAERGAFAPSLWPLEAMNGLLMQSARSASTRGDATVLRVFSARCRSP